MNINFSILNIYLCEFNVLLTNTLNKIHPFIFYVNTLIFFLIFFLFLFLITSNKIYYSNINTNILIKNLKIKYM